MIGIILRVVGIILILTGIFGVENQMNVPKGTDNIVFGVGAACYIVASVMSFMSRAKSSKEFDDAIEGNTEKSENS